MAVNLRTMNNRPFGTGALGRPWRSTAAIVLACVVLFVAGAVAGRLDLGLPIPRGIGLPRGADPFPGRNPVISPPEQNWIEDQLKLMPMFLQRRTGLAFQLYLAVSANGNEIGLSGINLEQSTRDAVVRLVTVRTGDAAGPRSFFLPSIGTYFQPTLKIERGVTYTVNVLSVDAGGRQREGEQSFLVPPGIPLAPVDLPGGIGRAVPVPNEPATPAPRPSPTQGPAPTATPGR